METTTLQNKSLGLTVTISGVPTTCEAYDAMAGAAGSCLRDAIQTTAFRSWNNDFRADFVEAVAKEVKTYEYPEGFDLTELDRKKVKDGPVKKDGTSNPILETEASYFDRILALTNKTVADFQALADKVSAAIPFDPSPAARTGGGSLPSAIKALAAKQFAEKTEAQLITMAGNLERLNPGTTVERDATGKPVELSFARALKVNNDRLLAESADSLGA